MEHAAVRLISTHPDARLSRLPFLYTCSPHLVLCHGVCVDEDSSFYALVLELCDGTLSQYLERVGCSTLERLRLLLQVGGL